MDAETVWLNRNQLAELFGRDVKTVVKHIANALKEELDREEVVAKFATTTQHGAMEGKTHTHMTEYYSLDMIISVGYRVKSKRGVEFRRCSCTSLTETVSFSVKAKSASIVQEVQEILGGVWLVKNGKLSQFLDTGWYMGASVFYQGYVYWCEAVTDFETNTTTCFVDRWKAESDGRLYHQFVTGEGSLIDYERVFEKSGTDVDELKKHFLIAPVFDGKSFWEVEKLLIWVDEGADIIN